jgi:hypothetical protein
LIFRNQHKDIVFDNINDLLNFSIRFISIKGEYFKNVEVRKANIEFLKKIYFEKATDILAENLANELKKISRKK